ncbi:MAG: VWA-like domain-containing protein [Intestinibacillus sp.]
MAQQERWLAIGREILRAARSELYLNFPFLDAALAALTAAEGYDPPTLATDGQNLYYSGAFLARQYEKSRGLVCRTYLHLLLHCLLRHHLKTRGRDRDLWDLSCDIAVESIIDTLDCRCLAPAENSVRRQNLYRKLRSELPVPTAEGIYRFFRREPLSAYDRATLARAFYEDDHSRWPVEQDDDRDGQQWQHISERTETSIETVFANQATGGEALREQLSVSTRATTNYRAFLTRFAVLREELGVDADAFDPGYYAYGLRHYGNMPLIEPLETREARRIEDFVIAIDTSMSTSGELVRAFLTYTYSILKDAESFFRRVNLRILQCDDRLRADRRITNAQELRDYMEHFELIGQSATDFRPVFQHVNALIAAGAFRHLRGLIYFTDGLGIYPKKRPPYDAAFVMLEGSCYPDKVPPWGIRAVLREDEIIQGENR